MPAQSTAEFLTLRRMDVRKPRGTMLVAVALVGFVVCLVTDDVA